MGIHHLGRRHDKATQQLWSCYLKRGPVYSTSEFIEERVVKGEVEKRSVVSPASQAHLLPSLRYNIHQQ